MNRFALELNVNTADIRVLEIEQRFGGEDWPAIEAAYMNAVEVTLVFRSFKINAIIKGWYREWATDTITVTWQSVGPLRVL